MFSKHALGLDGYIAQALTVARNAHSEPDHTKLVKAANILRSHGRDGADKYHNELHAIGTVLIQRFNFGLRDAVIAKMARSSVVVL